MVKTHISIVSEVTRMNNSNIKVSIITTTFNSAKTIEDTLMSVLKQTHQNIEYWIIDALSNDNTIDIVHRYQKMFNGRLHCISEPDKGIYDAMNKGLEKVTGYIVGILNSDDYFTSDDALEKIVETFSNYEVDAVYGDIHFIHANKPDKVVRYYSSSMFRPFWLRFGFMPAHPSFYVKNEIYRKYGTYSLNYKIASDYDLMVRFFYKYKIKAKYIKKDFVTMRIGGMSTRNITNRMLINKEDVMACRKYGLYTNKFLIMFKYLYKIFEFRIK